MISYQIDRDEVESATFGISALSETVLSLRVLRWPDRHRPAAALATTIRSAHRQFDFETLDALVAPDESTPDFLNPRPNRPVMDFPSELSALANVPLRDLSADLHAIHPHGLPRPLRGPLAQVRERVLTAIAGYWRTCIRPWWPRMLATLRADIMHRAMHAVDAGFRPMLTGLAAAIRWEPKVIHGWNPNGPAYEAVIGGRGLALIPTHFTESMSYPFSATSSPYLLYPARGRAGTFSLHGCPLSPDSAGLAKLIGRASSRVLLAVEQPMSSTDLSVTLGVTVTGANQHLRRLLSLGLLHSARQGRSVVYYRAPLGEQLIAQCSPPSPVPVG